MKIENNTEIEDDKCRLKVTTDSYLIKYIKINYLSFIVIKFNTSTISTQTDERRTD